MNGKDSTDDVLVLHVFQARYDRAARAFSTDPCNPTLEDLTSAAEERLAVHNATPEERVKLLRKMITLINDRS